MTQYQSLVLLDLLDDFLGGELIDVAQSLELHLVFLHRLQHLLLRQFDQNRRAAVEAGRGGDALDLEGGFDGAFGQQLCAVVADEVVVVEGELADVAAEVLHGLEAVLLGGVGGEEEFAEGLAGVLVVGGEVCDFEHGEVEEGPGVELVVQTLDDALLHLHQFLHGQLLVADLLEDRLHLQREHFLHLAGNQHALHPDDVQFGRADALPLRLEVAVHEGDAVEVGLGAELVGTGDFDHPVEHAGAEESVDLVVAEEGRGVGGVVGGEEGLRVVEAEEGGVGAGLVLLGQFGGQGVGEGLVEFVGGEGLLGKGGQQFPSLVAVLQVVLLLVEGLAVANQLLHPFINIFYYNQYSHHNHIYPLPPTSIQSLLPTLPTPFPQAGQLPAERLILSLNIIEMANMGRNCRSALEQVAGWEAREDGEEGNIYWQLRDNLHRYEKGYSKWQAQQLPPIMERPTMEQPRKSSLKREDKENELKLPHVHSTPLKKLPPKQLFLSLKQKNLFDEVQHHTQPLKNSPTLLLEQIRSRRNRNLCNLKPLHDSHQEITVNPPQEEQPSKKHKLLTICTKFRHSKLDKHISTQLIESQFNDDKITDFDVPHPHPPPSRSSQLP